MGYISLYRQWRPQTFEDFVGQDHIVKTLTHALELGRTAHAYLFCGPRGTGKTTTARILAKALNCTGRKGAHPCGACPSCRHIVEGNSLDVLEIDGASNRGIDEIRDLREKVNLAPTDGRFKVYIIDEVHMLTNEAFNALLKTLEEPPGHVVFIMATTEPHKLPATIISRCQRFDFRRFSLSEITGSLEKMVAAEGRSAEPAALSLIAEHADGGMRDAQGVLEQCLVFGSGTLTLADVQEVLGVVDRRTYVDLGISLAEGDFGAALEQLFRLNGLGKDLLQFARGAVRFFRDLLLLQALGPGRPAGVPESDRGALQSLAQRLSAQHLFRAVDAFARVDRETRDLGDARLALEMALARLFLVSAPADGPSEATAEVLRSLEARISALEGQRTVVSPPKGERSAPAPKPGVPVPAAESAPARVEPAAVELATLRDQWPAILEMLKREKISLQAFALESSVVAVEGRVVKLGFTERYGLHRERVQAEHEIVERAIQKATGQQLRVECVTIAENRPAVEQKSTTWQEEPAVKAAVDIFGGDVKMVGSGKGGTRDDGKHPKGS